MRPLLRLSSLCCSACALTVALLAQGNPASAQEDTAAASEDAAAALVESKTARHGRTLRDDGWSFFVGPYIWFAAVNGTSYVDGQATDIDIGFDGLFTKTIGGFGIGDAARFSWQAVGNLGFKVKKRITVTFGYRALASDTVTGEGDNRNGADLLQHGPMVGAGFTF